MTEQDISITNENKYLIDLPTDQQLYKKVRITIIVLAIIGLTAYFVTNRIKDLMQENSLTFWQACKVLCNEIGTFFYDGSQQAKINLIVFSILLLGGTAILVRNAYEEKLKVIRNTDAVKMPENMEMVEITTNKDTKKNKSKKPSEKIITISQGNLTSTSLKNWRRVEYRCVYEVETEQYSVKRRAHMDVSTVQPKGVSYAPIYEHQIEFLQDIISLIFLGLSFPFGFFLNVPLEYRIILTCINYGTVVSLYNFARAVFIGPYIAYRLIQERNMTQDQLEQLKDRRFQWVDIYKEIKASLVDAVMAPFHSVAISITLIYNLLVDPLNGRKWGMYTELRWSKNRNEGGAPGWNRHCKEFEGGCSPSNLKANAYFGPPCRRPWAIAKFVDGKLVDVQSPSGERHMALAYEAIEGETDKDPNSHVVIDAPTLFSSKQKQFIIFRNEEVDNPSMKNLFPNIKDKKFVIDTKQ